MSGSKTDRRRIIGIMAIAQAAAASSVLAGSPSEIWNGLGTPANPTSWGDRFNWAGNALPPIDADVVFGTGFTSGLNITLAGEVSASQFHVDTASAFNLMPDPGNPTKPLNLTSGLLTRSAASTGTQTISAPVNLSSQQWNIAGSGALVISGTVSGGAIFKGGAGTLVLSGSNTYAGMVLQAGTLMVSADENLGAAGTAVALNGGVLHMTAGIASPRSITIGGGFSATVQQDSATSTFTGGMTGAGTLTTAGLGMLRVTNVRTNGLTVSAGTVAIIAGGGSLGTSRVQSLALGGTPAAPVGRLDLNDHNLVIDYTGSSPLDNVRQEIQSGFANGAWSGSGIASSAAASSTGHKTALGYAEASAVNLTSGFDGVTTDSTSVIIRYTYGGDANLDKTVNSADFTQLASHFNATGSSWLQGDFNYDGVVNALDFNLLASNFGQTLTAPSLGALDFDEGSRAAGNASRVVPEPATISFAAALAALLLPRRRFRQA